MGCLFIPLGLFTKYSMCPNKYTGYKFFKISTILVNSVDSQIAIVRLLKKLADHDPHCFLSIQ